MKKITKRIAKLLDDGLGYHKKGNYQSAIDTYDIILRKNPKQPEALWLKALVMIELGDFSEAIEFLEKASSLKPSDASILNDLGIAYERNGRRDLAKKTFNNVLSIDPKQVNARFNLARSELFDGDPSIALEALNTIVSDSPHWADAHNLRGLALRKQNLIEESLKSYSVALALNPNDSGTIFNKADLLYTLGRFEDALQLSERSAGVAIQNSEDWAKAIMLSGLILYKLGEIKFAKERYDSVIELLPFHFETLINRGELNQAEGRIDEARQDFMNAISVDKNNAVANYNISRIFLLEEKWSDGWLLYEYRWATEQFSGMSRDRGLDLWNPVMDGSESILVWGEQGLGDQVLFASNLTYLLNQNFSVVVEVDERLVSIIERSFPEISVYGYDMIPEEITENFNAHIPLGSLGRYFGRSINSKITPKSYLVSDPMKTKSIKKRYSEMFDSELLIGIAWNSINPNLGRHKSLSLVQWEPILKFKNINFVSLQYTNEEIEISEINNTFGIDIFIDKEFDPILDIEMATSQIDSMDLIICTSNTIAHIAGALGKKVWLMSQKVPEWRWGIRGQKSFWYPNVKIYRQKQQGMWKDVVENISLDLEEFIKNYHS